MADYMRTNDYTIPQFKHARDSFVAAGVNRDIALAALGVKTEYFDGSFDEMHKQYGTIERYFAEGPGIDATGQNALRDMFFFQGTSDKVRPKQQGRSRKSWLRGGNDRFFRESLRSLVVRVGP